MGGRVLRLSLDRSGCRAVQAALQAANNAEAMALVDEIRGHVRKAIKSAHGNYVIQKIVEALPTSLSSFVADELVGVGANVARDRYGCRIICRLLEHSACDRSTEVLMDEVLEDVLELCRHSYGHHVVLTMLEHGTLSQRSRIASGLRGGLLRSARNRFASRVLEQTFIFCSVQDKHAIASDLVSSPDTVQVLAEHQCGCFVVRAILRLQDEYSQKVMDHLQPVVCNLQLSKWGKRVLHDFENVPKRN